MKNSKLTQLLKTFSEEEIIEFEKYLKSPLSNSRNYILKFFIELKKHYPEFKEDKIDRKVIFSKIYKGKKFNDSTVRSIVSNLIADAEHFLSYINFRKNKTFQDFYLLSELRIRELHSYYDIKAKPILNNIKNQKEYDFNDLIYQYLLTFEITDQYMHREGYESSVELVDLLNNNLLTFFIANANYTTHYSEILKTFFPFETNSYLEHNFYPNFNFEGFINSLADNDSNRAKYLMLNYNLYNLITDKNSHESFAVLKKLWINSSDFLSPASRESIYDFLGNFCLIQNRNKGSIYEREFFELSKIMLKDKLFLSGSNNLHLNTFRQITLHCFSLNEIQWVEDFVKGYAKYLADDEREMLVELAMSEITFKKKDYKSCLEHLSNIKVLKNFMKIELKENYIKVFYELNYTEQLYSAFDSFRHYLKNAPFLPNYIRDAKNFLKYITAISNYKNKNNSDLHILKKQLIDDPHVHIKSWLLEKIDELLALESK